MGLPNLNDPALVQAMADVVNGYPFPAERVDFFCDLLNECEGANRRDMYEAMRPLLHFPVPALDVCEARVAAKAERLIRPRGIRGYGVERPNCVVVMECAECGKKQAFGDDTTTGAILEARKAGWGRGPQPGLEYCVSCRLITMPERYDLPAEKYGVTPSLG